MRLKTSLISTIFSTLLFAMPVLAETVFVDVPSTEGVGSETVSTLKELVKAAVTEQSGYELSQSQDKANVVVRARLLKLGSAYLLSVDKLRGDKVVHTAKLRAARLEDLDTVTERVVKSALNEASAADQAQVDTVTEDEVSRGTLKRQATRQWRLGFGPSWGSNLGAAKSGIAWHLGYNFGVDVDWDLDLSYRGSSYDGNNGSSPYMSELMVGTSYSLTRSKNSPFVSFAAGRGWAEASRPTTGFFSSSDDTASGWATRLGVGLKMFRTSTVNLGFELTYTHLFADLSRSKNQPGVTALMVSLYY